MDGCYPSKLRVWEGGGRQVAHDLVGAAEGRAFAGPHHPAEFARRLYASESLNASAVLRVDEAVEPYTLQWFLDIERVRHGRSGRWIPRLLEFAKHPGETLLGLGDGLGTDWLQYARHGTAVIVCSPSAHQLSLVRRNFELRGLSGRFLHAAPTCLPLESASIDVVCISSLFQHHVEPAQVVEEVYRILKPGGKVLAVTPARYDVDYWARHALPWRRWTLQPTETSLEAVRFTGRSLKCLFGRFVEMRIHKRQLRRRELPPLWRWVPLPLLERLLGRILVLKAFKPLSAVTAMQAAA